VAMRLEIGSEGFEPSTVGLRVDRGRVAHPRGIW
jgi:hypothetical protein